MAPLTASSPHSPPSSPSSLGLFNVWLSGFWSLPTLLLLFLFFLLFQHGLIHPPIAEMPQFLSLPQAQSSSFRRVATCLLYISTSQACNFNLPHLKPNSELFFSLVLLESNIPCFIHWPTAKNPNTPEIFGNKSGISWPLTYYNSFIFYEQTGLNLSLSGHGTIRLLMVQPHKIIYRSYKKGPWRN